MNGISFVEGSSTNFGEEPVKTVSVQSQTGKMDFIIKPGEHSCVSGSMGTTNEMKRLTAAFLDKYSVSTLINQVHRSAEARAMFHNGFRLVERKQKRNAFYNEPETLRILKERSSVLMAWKGIVPEPKPPAPVLKELGI